MSFLDIEGHDRTDLEATLDLADEFIEVLRRPIPRVPALQGKTIAHIFYEASTRTRLSFERAAKALSADVMNFAPSGSSVSKGESLKDTVLTLRAMGPDLMVVRHGAAGAPHRVAAWTGLPVINAGDGAHQHPTQALADSLTIRTRFGKLDGLRVGIIGDIRHSRVARSNVAAFTALGAEVVLVAPRTLLPVSSAEWPVTMSESLDEIIEDLDVVYLLRIQVERGGACVFPSLTEYVSRFGLTSRRFSAMNPEAVVMHPGPMNRGIEIADSIADDERALVLDQVSNGVAVRMAVLFRLLGGDRNG